MRILDLFCGAGGASAGYAAAGHELVGVDHRPMSTYPYAFHRADAMAVLRGEVPGLELDRFDLVHASPPCQAYSRVGGRIWKNSSAHPDLLAPTLDLLRAWGGPFVLENVDGAPFPWAFQLCGWGFGLAFHRHRYFMLRDFALVPAPGCPGPTPEGVSINPYRTKNGRTMAELRAEMGVGWMTLKQTSQAIPPAYTAWIAEHALVL